MSFTKTGIYILLFACLFSGVLESTYILYYILLGFMFVDCRDFNVRMLLGLIIIFAFMLYEVDNFMMILTRDIFQTGKVWGDLILNLFIIINYTTLIFSIFFRDEVMQFVAKIIGIPPVDYIPTRADVIQIYVARLMLTYCVVVTLYMGFIAYQYFDAVAIGDDALSQAKLDYYRQISSFFVEYSSYLGTFKLLTLVLTTHKWSHKKMGDNRPQYIKEF